MIKEEDSAGMNLEYQYLENHPPAYKEGTGDPLEVTARGLLLVTAPLKGHFWATLPYQLEKKTTGSVHRRLVSGSQRRETCFYF